LQARSAWSDLWNFEHFGSGCSVMFMTFAF
jgi:hypothetical protein